jgi:hypothetical protein
MRENGMSNASEGSVLGRRRFLALSVAGLAVVALPGSPAAFTGKMRTFSHSGREVSVGNLGQPELIVDGEALEVVFTNGAYRAVEFAFSPQPTLEALGRRVAENAGRIPGRF